MILPNATSFDTLGPRKAFTIITKDGGRLDMILTQMVLFILMVFILCHPAVTYAAAEHQGRSF